MTPETFQRLVDNLDEKLDLSMQVDEETLKEWQIIHLAKAAVRYNALSEQVGRVRANFHVRPIAQIAQNQTAVVRRFFAQSMKVAAVFVLVLGVAGMAKFLFTTPSGVYGQYYSPYELTVSRGSHSENTIEQAYQNKQWNTVVTDFNVSASKTTEEYFLTAMANMELKKYNEAIVLFKSLMRSNTTAEAPLFQDESEYYLAMSYLATGQASLAIPLFDKIKSDPHHLFYNKVNEMNAPDMLILRSR